MCAGASSLHALSPEQAARCFKGLELVVMEGAAVAVAAIVDVVAEAAIMAETTEAEAVVARAVEATVADKSTVASVEAADIPVETWDEEVQEVEAVYRR